MPPDQQTHPLLQALGDPPQAEIDAAKVAIAVAHPDDETVGCGGQLSRLRGISVIVTTDGAPRNLVDAHAHGFSSAKAYADARQRELRRALACASVPDEALICLGAPDQQAARRLAPLTRRLVTIFRRKRIGTVLTHAYEGGHPDHDATAFAVHMAARLLGEFKPDVLEMPFYRAGGMQRFRPDPRYPEVAAPLSSEQRARKQTMLMSHYTQRSVLSGFSLDVEWFRRAPAYDFCALPNGGDILYDAHDWGLRSTEWVSLARAALADLRMGETP